MQIYIYSLLIFDIHFKTFTQSGVSANVNNSFEVMLKIPEKYVNDFEQLPAVF
jgi:hypothetical protein